MLKFIAFNVILSISSSGIVNPLVSAGLISPNLMDVVAVPPPDPAVNRETKKITGALCLPSEGNAAMLRN